MQRIFKSVLLFSFLSLAAQAVSADPSYYHWSQWFFNKLIEMGLAYRKMSAVDFCPHCNTTLAREQVWGEDKHCERCGTPVIKKDLEQMKGIDRIDRTALYDPELQVLFDPRTLHKYGIKPGDIDWEHIFGEHGSRWFHTGGIFAALSATACTFITMHRTFGIVDLVHHFVKRGELLHLGLHILQLVRKLGKLRLGGFRVACGDGAIDVTRAQRLGKRAMDADEVLRGMSLPSRLA